MNPLPTTPPPHVNTDSLTRQLRARAELEQSLRMSELERLVKSLPGQFEAIQLLKQAHELLWERKYEQLTLPMVKALDQRGRHQHMQCAALYERPEIADAFFHDLSDKQVEMLLFKMLDLNPLRFLFKHKGFDSLSSDRRRELANHLYQSTDGNTRQELLTVRPDLLTSLKAEDWTQYLRALKNRGARLSAAPRDDVDPSVGSFLGRRATDYPEATRAAILYAPNDKALEYITALTDNGKIPDLIFAAIARNDADSLGLVNALLARDIGILDRIASEPKALDTILAALAKTKNLQILKLFKTAINKSASKDQHLEFLLGAQGVSIGVFEKGAKEFIAGVFEEFASEISADSIANVISADWGDQSESANNFRDALYDAAVMHVPQIETVAERMIALLFEEKISMLQTYSALEWCLNKGIKMPARIDGKLILEFLINDGRNSLRKVAAVSRPDRGEVPSTTVTHKLRNDELLYIDALVEIIRRQVKQDSGSLDIAQTENHQLLVAQLAAYDAAKAKNAARPAEPATPAPAAADPVPPAPAA